MALSDGANNPWGYDRRVTKNSDGTFTDSSGRVFDQWGNTWNPTTGQWYNQGGEQWMGTNPANGTGLFGPPDSYLDTQGNVVGGGSGGFDPSILLGGGGGGSGGSSGPSQLDYDIFNEQKRQFDTTFTQDREQREWQNNFDIAQFNWQKAQDDRDYALAVGDLDLARKKQDDANYWQGESNKIDRERIASSERMNAADNSTRLSVANIDAQSRMQTAQIAAAADRYAADQRLREGLANAHNEQERNRVMLAHEQELAQIAKMEDETKRLLAAEENRISGFNAETARMAQMGDIALKNNQFLLDNSNNPRNMFGMYFMQRGVTPDWDSLAAGNPIQGQALQVYDPMKAYAPNITMDNDFSIGPGSAFGQVGNKVNGMGLAANPYLQGGLGAISGGGQQPAPQQQGMPQPSPMMPQPQPQSQPASHPGVSQPTPRKGGFTYTLPGLAKFASGTDYADFGQNMGMQQNVGMKPGFTTESQFMVGDAPSKNPTAGGARPEIIYNPTNAPIRIQNTAQTMQALDFGAQPVGTMHQKKGGATSWPMMPEVPMLNSVDNPRDYVRDPLNMQYQEPRIWGQNAFPQRMPSVRSNTQQMPQFTPPQQTFSYEPLQKNAIPQRPLGNTNFVDYGPVGQQTGGFQQDIFRYPSPVASNRIPPQSNAGGLGWWQQFRPEPGRVNPYTVMPAQSQSPSPRANYGLQAFMNSLNRRRFASGTDIPRYAIGTDMSQQYANMGMGNLWLGSSSNEHLQGYDNVPQWLQTLADYGAPIAPALADSVTGRTSPQLDLASVFTQRGGGILPSLQKLNNSSASENQLFQGYVSGPVGLPDQDVLDFIGRPTQNLRTAQRSSGTIM